MINKKDGFTLIEVVVSIFIIGLLVTLAIPRLPDITGYKLKISARKISNVIKYVRNRAIIKKNTFRLVFDIDKGNYSVEVFGGDGFKKFQSLFSTDNNLPKPIAFEDVEVKGYEKRGEGTISTYFNINGFIPETIIHLIDTNSNKKVTIFVHPFSGRVLIQKGYMEERL